MNIIQETRVQLGISRGSYGAPSRAGGQSQVARRAPNTRFDPFLFEVGYYLVFLEATTRPELLQVSNTPISFKLNETCNRPLNHVLKIYNICDL